MCCKEISFPTIKNAWHNIPLFTSTGENFPLSVTFSYVLSHKVTKTLSFTPQEPFMNDIMPI